MRRIIAILIIALVSGACGSNAATEPPSAAPAPAAEASDQPSLSAAPAATPSPRPTATPEPARTIGDLIADPLPAVTLEQIGALDPANWALLQALPTFKVSYEIQNPETPPGDSLALGAWLCQAPLALSKAAERLVIRESHCLLLVAAAWRADAADGGAAMFDQARAAYAFAATTLGPEGRTFVDDVLRAKMPAVGATPTPDPAPTDLRTVDQFLAEPFKRVDPYRLATLIRDTLAENPVLASGWLGGTVPVGRVEIESPDDGPQELPRTVELDSRIAVCMRGHDGASDVFDGGWAGEYSLIPSFACEGVIKILWARYRATGWKSAYAAALAAYRLGIQGLPPCERLGVHGFGCPDEWVESLRRFTLSSAQPDKFGPATGSRVRRRPIPMRWSADLTSVRREYRPSDEPGQHVPVSALTLELAARLMQTEAPEPDPHPAHPFHSLNVIGGMRRYDSATNRVTAVSHGISIDRSHWEA